MKPNSLTYDVRAFLAFTVAVGLIQESAPRSFMADSKFRDREFQKRAIPWAGIVLVFLMIISPMLPLFDEQNQKSNDVLKDSPEGRLGDMDHEVTVPPLVVGVI